MKYIKKILLGFVMTCLLMTVYIKPVSADSSWFGLEWFNVRNIASSLSKNEEISFTIIGSLNAEHERGPIVITGSDCTLRFKSYFKDQTAIISSDGYYDFPFIIVKGDNVNIIFENIEIHGFKSDGDGGAIYVDGEDCYITGGYFTGCYADTDGGAICLNEDDGVVDDCDFYNCVADDDGGAIYVCAGADDCVIKNCDFDSCKCDDRGNAVCGDNDTKVSWCTSNTKNSYKLCKVSNSSGSTISQGSIIIIASVLVVAAIIVIILVINKRKKNKVDSK